MTLNDAILAATGGTTVNDGLALWFGKTASESLNDAERRWLLENGGNGGTNNDMWWELLSSAGYVGTINDKLLQFWLAGGSFRLQPIAGWTGNQGCSVGIAEAIIDDEDGVYVNTWTFSSFASGYHGIGYHHFNDGTNTGGSCTFPLPVEAVGDFEVYVRWPGGSGRATAATYTVNHVDGSDDIVFDQNIDGAQFNLMGVFKLDLTSDVVLKSSDSGAVIADAIKIIRV